MVSELQTTLRRLQAKSDVLLEKYHALKLEKEAVEQENDQLRSRLAQLDKEIEKLRTELFTIISEHSGQPYDKVAADGERDFWMTAQEALEYGMVDQILIKNF